MFTPSSRLHSWPRRVSRAERGHARAPRSARDRLSGADGGLARPSSRYPRGRSVMAQRVGRRPWRRRRVRWRWRARSHRTRECPSVRDSENRAHSTGRFATSGGRRTKIIRDVGTRSSRLGRGSWSGAPCLFACNTHGLDGRRRPSSGSVAPASMAAPRPSASAELHTLFSALLPISLATRRAPSVHLDATAHRPRRDSTRINTPRTVFCYIGWLFFEKSIYIFPEFRDTDESMSSAG